MPAWLESPYKVDDGGFWLKGNLHTHTTRSDGRSDPQDVVRHYAGLGYDFLMLSDHDVLADYSKIDPCGMVLIDGIEITGSGGHILDVGARKKVAPGGDQQKVIDEVMGQSGFAILNHPNWEEDFDHYPFETLMKLQNYVGIEICNGVVIFLPGNHLATDKWDHLLGEGRKLWGFANDDAHNIAHHSGLCWNVVRVKERTAAAIVAALRAGNFYASTGVEIREITCEGSSVHVVAPNARRIAVFGRHGVRLTLADGPELTFDAGQVNGSYIRVECYGDGGDMAWTQPLFVRDGIYETTQRNIAAAEAGGKAVLQAMATAQPPKMTGYADDPLWAKAPVHRVFLDCYTARPCPLVTEARCIVSGGVLHFAFVCQEPKLEEMKLGVKSDGQTNMWTDDSVELFLDANRGDDGYHQIIVNALGYHGVLSFGSDSNRKLTIKSAARQWERDGLRCWTAELSVPLSELGPGGSAGELGMHICRNRNAETGGSFVWSWVGASNHNCKRFGTLKLR